ncbi:V-set and transmembrane domain-containing protein 2-like protein [Acipenser oxyrinchus oxyrinchus]|uniref:V-set and transmembrane domain-containing protein 2-like protein n=1 Tax=Acipenser oxyrinchus oxyrinchus TaxID=40147 RepID=A0AAD8CT01_ACIOX|nr:V-set and transmembrane domain-containing protein 2-like protein [Acipenser oxyrinchus oxyrinchus]
MGAFGVVIGILHCMGLYIQLSASSKQAGYPALFTEVPHDITTQPGQDVEMACSFRGSGSPSYSLEIQWWYIRNHKDWMDKQAWTSNQVRSTQNWGHQGSSHTEVVKVAGSNISHKLRLSSVKPSDEGTYECRVIDFSDGKARHHKVRAYLQVEPNQNSEPQHHSTGPRPQETKAGSHQSNHGKHAPTHSHHKGGRELKKQSAENANDCTDSCVL